MYLTLADLVVIPTFVHVLPSFTAAYELAVRITRESVKTPAMVNLCFINLDYIHVY